MTIASVNFPVVGRYFSSLLNLCVWILEFAFSRQPVTHNGKPQSHNARLDLRLELVELNMFLYKSKPKNNPVLH